MNSESSDLYQYTAHITVPDEDIDDMGHVNNVAYLRYVESVAREHSESVGLGLQRYREFGGVFVVRRHTVTYHRPAYAGELLALKTRVRDFRGVRTTRDVHIYRGEELLIEAETEWVWVDQDTYQPKRIPNEIQSALPPVNEKGGR